MDEISWKYNKPIFLTGAVVSAHAPLAHGTAPSQGSESAACAEFGCWEGAQGSVRNTTTFLRRAISYLDSDPRVLKCVLYSRVRRCRRTMLITET